MLKDYFLKLSEEVEELARAMRKGAKAQNSREIKGTIENSYTADRQDLQWCLRESAWLAVCSRVALQIYTA